MITILEKKKPNYI